MNHQAATLVLWILTVACLAVAVWILLCGRSAAQTICYPAEPAVMCHYIGPPPSWREEKREKPFFPTPAQQGGQRERKDQSRVR